METVMSENDDWMEDINALAGQYKGRWVDLYGGSDAREVRGLDSRHDFRHPMFRREVFIRFYMFHLRHRAHPGCVYYLMPHLSRAHEEPWDFERQLWYAFINGCTQHPVTSLIIMRRFPQVPRPEQLVDLERWFNENWASLPFDTDRRYQKKEFPRAASTYMRWLDGRTQEDAFCAVMPWTWEWGNLPGGHRYKDFGDVPAGYEEANFDALWKLIQSKAFWGFGRLAAWSYLEYLRIMGLPLEPSSMMLRDMDGSKSHRNGLAKVLGRDDLDWTKQSPFQGEYSKEVLAWLEEEADALLAEVRERWDASPWRCGPGTLDISRFTLESALCTFKGWFRENRRYPNVYNDMLRDRIEHVQRLWPDEDLEVFWQARRECLPEALRVEDNPTDPGLAKPKQNHFRLTGQVPMLGTEWAVFRHDESAWRLPA